jgi:hypothetical protein
MGDLADVLCRQSPLKDLSCSRHGFRFPVVSA